MKLKIARKTTGHRLNAVGAYIFGGGFTAGVRDHFNVVAHLEDGNFGVATSKRHNPGLVVYENPATWPQGDTVDGKRVDFVYANPPCAPWSQASARGKESWKSDDRVECVAKVFNLLGQLRPRAWCFESVRGAYTKGRPMIDNMAAEARDLGYKATYLLTDALNHGVPQNRPRFFLVLSDVDVPWRPAGGEPTPCGPALRRGLPDEPREKRIEQTRGDLLPHCKPGQLLKTVFLERNRRAAADLDAQMRLPVGERKPVKGQPGFLVRRLDGDRPSYTITGGCNKIHPDEDRYISVPESAALCGYPDGYDFVGAIGNQYAQIGKAVMPPVGSWLAGCVKAGIEAGREPESLSPELVTIGPDWVERTPLAETKVMNFKEPEAPKKTVRLKIRRSA